MINWYRILFNTSCLGASLIKFLKPNLNFINLKSILKKCKYLYLSIGIYKIINFIIYTVFFYINNIEDKRYDYGDK